MFFFQRTNCAGRNNSLHAQFFHGIDIGTKVQLRRQDVVAAAMTGEKGNSLPFQSARNKIIGRSPKRRLQAYFLEIGQSCHLIKPASTDDPNRNFFQGLSSEDTSGSTVFPLRIQLKLHESISDGGMQLFDFPAHDMERRPEPGRYYPPAV